MAEKTLSAIKVLVGSIIILIILGLVCCIRPMGYTEATSSLGTKGYGYSDKRINDDEFSIVVTGNSLTSKERVAEIALMRAARLTEEEGRTHFVIINQKAETTERAKLISKTVDIGGMPISVPYREYFTEEPMAILLIRLLPLQPTYPPDTLNAADVIEGSAKYLE